MANEKIGQGVNRRQLRHAPWWATDQKHIIGFSVGIGLLTKVMSNLMTWGLTRLIGYSYSAYQGFANNPMLKASYLMRQWQHQPFNVRTIFKIGLPPGGWIAWLSLIIWLAVAVLAIVKMSLVYRSYNTLEHGAETFATISDIKRAYPVVPDRVAQFDGIGGVPISHFNNAYGSTLHWLLAHKWVPGSQSLVKVIQNGTFPTGQYAIDTATNNTLGIGITRSGKGETFGLPTIDLLSRAQKRSSLIVNDPKRELANLSQAMLRERGYRVMVLDLQSMANSMGYNPLTVIVNYARKGNWSKVQMETNRLSTAIYVRKGQGDSSGDFFNNSSINLLNALILAQIDLAYRHHSWEKVSLHNVYEMMTDLGGRQIVITNAKGKPIGQVSALTEYFNKLRELNDKNAALVDEDGSQEVRRLALDAFAQSKFAGSETAGSIYATMMEGIKIYQQRDLAQLTAQSTFDVREAGFSRWLSLQLPQALANEPVNLVIWETNKAGKRTKKIENRQAQIDEVGRLEYPIEQQLPVNFMIQVQLPTEVLVQPIGLQGHKQVGLKGKTTVHLNPAPKPVMNATLHYSDQPIALFLVTPPDNPSYNQIVSFFIDQSFNQLYGMATASGGKTFTRVHYLLDEFGNLPKVSHMDTKVSIGLGQNILFTLIVQNLSQLRLNYTEEQAQTIESNCANTVYILTKELKTAETISKSLGDTTINSFQHRGKDVLEDFGNSNNSGMALMTPAELMRLNTGESVVLRTTRNSLTGADVRNNAIFNRGKTRMPFRWQFLGQTFHVDHGRLRPLEASPMQIDLRQRSYKYMEEYELLENAADLTPFDEGLQSVDTEAANDETKADETTADRMLGLTQSEWASLNEQDGHNQLSQLLQKMVQAGVSQELVGLISQGFHEDTQAALTAVQEHWHDLQQYQL